MTDQQIFMRIFENKGFSIENYERGERFEIQSLGQTVCFEFEKGALVAVGTI